MKKIKLGSSNKYALVDDWAFEFLKDVSWWFHRSSKYAATKFNGKFYVMHMLIAGTPPNQMQLVTDHKNRNRLDNRSKNLRIIPRALNAVNVSLPQKTRGVSFHKHNRRWVAYIGSSPRVYLGSFSTESLACKARDKAASQRWGKLAILNKENET